MNSKQLRWILSRDPITRKTFVDVYARDGIKLINSVAFPSAYIFNFDPGTKPGLHWVEVYFHSNRTGEYFNSFGRPPIREIEQFLNTYAEKWQYNRLQVQELYTTTCGQFSVFYIYQKCKGLSLDCILRKYFTSQGRVMKDMLVRDFVKIHDQFSAKVMDFGFMHSLKEKFKILKQKAIPKRINK